MEKELMDFIRRVKQQTYASETSVAKEVDGGGKSYRIEEGDWVYTDTYFGNLIDSGQERVFENGKVIWVMAYRGGMVEGFEKMREKAFGFLKKCISQVPEDFPVRGPRYFKSGDWEYENDWEGDIGGFVGEENIFLSGERVCFRNYLGGLVKNK